MKVWQVIPITLGPISWLLDWLFLVPEQFCYIANIIASSNERGG